MDNTTNSDMAKTEKSFWLSYDLGLKGDYSGLYTWLDGKKAVECGNSIAFFKLPISTTGDIDTMISEMKLELQVEVSIDSQKDRIYIMYMDSEGNMKGKFIFGRRKPAPWEGYSGPNPATFEDF